MFDFSSLTTVSSSDLPATLEELFGQLDRKATHTSLRPVQRAAMLSLDLQLDKTDVVIKLSTGSGKTVVGLVFAERMRRRHKGEPVVFLCPTVQLVEQVVAAGQAIGVPVSVFPEYGLPYGAINGEAVLVCTYNKLFNSKSVFESRNIQPSCIVLDDIHAGVERVKQCYTAIVPNECYSQIRTILKPLCEASDAATWHGIDRNDAGSRYEVPYWVWSSVQKEICAILERQKDSSDLQFCWGNINRYAELARFCLSGTTAEISLPIPPVEENFAYSKAKHRLFMSASIKDGSTLIGAMDCDVNAFSRLIEPIEDEGAGERMILPISLINNNSGKLEIAALCASLAKKTNVVVLTSSIAQAKAWEEAGAVLPSRKDFESVVEQLRTTSKNYVVFAQRFDGVDLADDACRVLILDGIPSGERVCDQVDAYRQKGSPEYEIRTVNRFEQALGRAVRSSADYAAILLVGSDIAAFISKKSVTEMLEERTRLQVDLGKELAKRIGSDKSIATVINEMTQALLGRNESWKDAHRTRVKGGAKQARSKALNHFESVAAAARSAWIQAKARNFQAAVAVLREGSNDVNLHKVQKAEIIYWVATYLHQFDPSGAALAYQSVFTLNSHFPRPEKVVDRKFLRLTEQAVAVRDYFCVSNSANGAIARLNEIRGKLAFANSAEVVEQGLFELGEALGATSSRPEKETGRGPDVLWLFDGCGACIEAKNEKTADIHKSDAAQLSLSHQWCRDAIEAGIKLPNAVFATNVQKADRAEDVSFEPKLLNEDAVMDLIERLGKLVLSLSFDGPLFTDPTAVAKKLQEIGITGPQILDRMPVMKS
jgi:Helicase C-terminal domain/Type III restriction enzyme, res subunit